MDPVSRLARAESLLGAGRAAEALPLLDRVAGREDRFFQADVQARRAEALRALSRFEEALEASWAAHRLYRLSGAAHEGWRSLLGASACLRVLSRYKEADRMWRSVDRRLPAPREEFELEVALVRRGLGRPAEAAALLRRLIPRLKDVEALQHAWWALAGSERFSGSYAKALHSFGQAARLARRNGDPSAEAYAWCGQAGCLRILGKGKESFRAYKAAHARFVREGDRFGEAYGLCGMGNALRVHGDPRKTLSLYNRSAALYKRVGDEGSRAFALWGLGGSSRRLGRLDDAQRYCRDALRGFRAVGDHRGVIMALLGLGRAAGEAVPLRRALALARRERLPYEAALARLELSRLAGAPLPAGLFKPFGVPPAAVRRWKDVP